METHQEIFGMQRSKQNNFSVLSFTREEKRKCETLCLFEQVFVYSFILTWVKPRLHASSWKQVILDPITEYTDTHRSTVRLWPGK